MILFIIVVLFFLKPSFCEGESANYHINIKADDFLLPETNADEDAPAETKNIEAEYDQGPLMRTNRKWVDVGTWTSDPIAIDATFEGTIQYNIWFQEYESVYDGDPDWRFEFLHNGETESSVEINTDSSKDEPIEITADSTLDEPINAKAGDTIGLHIEYRAWEDCDIYFDNMDYDSGILIQSDFIHAFKLYACGNKVELEAYDAFESDWDNVKHFIDLDINGESIVAESIETKGGETHDIDGIDIVGTIIRWELENTYIEDDEVGVLVKCSNSCEGMNEESTFRCIKPTASIVSINPNPEYEGDIVSFSGSGTGEGGIVSYQWDSSIDGFLSDEDSFDNATLSVGLHTINFKVKDDFGTWSDTINFILEVLEYPIANVSLSRTTIKEGDGLTIDANSSSGSNLEYYFDFGDNQSSNWSTEPIVDHIYTKKGTYTLKVKVRDEYGEESNYNSTIIKVEGEGNGDLLGWFELEKGIIPILIVLIVLVSALALVKIKMKPKVPQRTVVSESKFDQSVKDQPKATQMGDLQIRIEDVKFIAQEFLSYLDEEKVSLNDEIIDAYFLVFSKEKLSEENQQALSDNDVFEIKAYTMVLVYEKEELSK